MRLPDSKILAIVGSVALAAALGPFISNYYAGLLSQVLIFALFAMSLDLLVGYTGLPSLGHSAFFGMGAYVAGLLALHYSQSFWLCAAAGVGAAMLTGALFGLLTLRTNGSSFLMITLALSQLLWGIAFKWRSVTGGEDGLSGITRPEIYLGWSISGELGFLYFVILSFGCLGILLALLTRSPFGLALVGVRESESRMKALGYNVWFYKYLVTLASSAVAGFSGVLFLYYNLFISPNYLSIGLSAKALLMVIMGGAGTLVGSILGSTAIVMLENVVSQYTERWMTIIGAVFVLVVLFFPKGVLGAIKAKVKVKEAAQ